MPRWSDNPLNTAGRILVGGWLILGLWLVLILIWNDFATDYVTFFEPGSSILKVFLSCGLALWAVRSLTGWLNRKPPTDLVKEKIRRILKDAS